MFPFGNLNTMHIIQDAFEATGIVRKGVWKPPPPGRIGRSDACPVNSREQTGLLVHGLVWRIWPLLPARIAVLQCWGK